MWDIATCACKHTLTHHSDKVQSVAWNSAQPSVLLSGGFDQAAFVVRCPGLEDLKGMTILAIMSNNSCLIVLRIRSSPVCPPWCAGPLSRKP